MKSMPYPVGEMLKQARKERNLTLEKLSRSSRVPPSTIWKYENETVDYSFFTILKLATALDKSFEYFLGRGGPEREDLVAAGPDDGVTCELANQRWRLDLFNRRLVGHWLINGVLRLLPGAEVRPKRMAGEELFLRCLEGPMEVVLGERAYSLTPGTALQFRTNESVSIHNRGDDVVSAELVATCFPFDL